MILESAEREQLILVWVAAMLSPRIEIAEALLRSESVPTARLDPKWAARLAADPSLVGTAADEILRRGHPVHHFRRTATRDVTVHGRRIAAGDKVTFWYASGNFDEERFADPYRLDVGRTPNRHLSFGLGGPHFCLGAHLAKLEIKIWLEEMIPYLHRIELAGKPVRLRSNMFHGIKRLPVRVVAA